MKQKALERLVVERVKDHLDEFYRLEYWDDLLEDGVITYDDFDRIETILVKVRDSITF